MPVRKKQKHGGTLQFWKKGESGNPNGRPRKVLRQLEEKVGIEFGVSLSKEDKFQILESMLEMSLTQLQSIATDKECPAFMVVIANGLKEDIKKGRINTLAECFDRFFGKAEQSSKMDITTKGESINEKRITFSDGTVRDKNGNITTLPAALESSD